jgi:hypothetical protein
MTCPYLRKIEAYYCEAYPQKVLVPGEPSAEESCQSKELFRSCSLFKEHEKKISRSLPPNNQPLK